MDLSKCTPKIRLIAEAEAVSAEWRAGFEAFNLQMPLDMRQGKDWAMGWLTARLIASAQTPPATRC